jgi:hypothetical protein
VPQGVFDHEVDKWREKTEKIRRVVLNMRSESLEQNVIAINERNYAEFRIPSESFKWNPGHDLLVELYEALGECLSGNKKANMR